MPDEGLRKDETVGLSRSGQFTSHCNEIVWYINVHLACDD